MPARINTLPMKVGVGVAERLSVGLQLVGGLMLLPVAATIDSRMSWSIVSAILVVAGVFVVLTLRRSRWYLSGNIYGSWIPMALGMALLCL